MNEQEREELALNGVSAETIEKVIEEERAREAEEEKAVKPLPTRKEIRAYGRRVKKARATAARDREAASYALSARELFAVRTYREPVAEEQSE